MNVLEIFEVRLCVGNGNVRQAGQSLLNDKNAIKATTGNTNSLTNDVVCLEIGSSSGEREVGPRFCIATQ